MKMDDNELKRLLQEGMEYEADRIMAEVESDPSMKDVVAPEEVYIKLKQQIREHQEEEERNLESRTKEEEELIRLGKIYKKKRSRRKYYVLLVAVICVLGVGTVSFGDGKKVFTKVQRMLGDRKQTVVNTDDGSGSVVDEISKEEEAYKKIEEKFGFFPIKLQYRPQGMEFVEQTINEDLQHVHLYYSDQNDKSISYHVLTKYRSGSSVVDIEDKFVQERQKIVGETSISIKEYEIEENKSTRWVVDFVFKEAQYTIIFSGIEEKEVEKTVDKLDFL